VSYCTHLIPLPRLVGNRPLSQRSAITDPPSNWFDYGLVLWLGLVIGKNDVSYKNVLVCIANWETALQLASCVHDSTHVGYIHC